MKILNKIRFTALSALIFIIVLAPVLFTVTNPSKVFAATSPNLGYASSFAVLGGTAVTNVPTSIITGDVGLSPAAGSNYAGLTNGEVSGTIFAVDASGPAGTAGNNPTLVNQAKTDLVTAYNGLAAGANADANCPLGYVFGAGNKDLTGLSLAPGLYCSDTFTLTGTLTLTGSGVWVFRSGASLITSGTANVVGGNPCDVWWQVPSSATLGAGTSLIGSILALTSITMNTGATLNGRALARNGAVTLQSNTINQSCTTVAHKASGTTTSSGGSSSAFCPPTGYVTPLIIESRRISPTSIFISWGPYSGINTFNIRYGFENGKWLYNTNVTGFSTTINGLSPNQPIWIQVAATNGCSVGIYGVSKLVGGPFLPNTGFAPVGNNIPWYISVGIFVGLSFLLVLLVEKLRLIQKKYKIFI